MLVARGTLRTLQMRSNVWMSGSCGGLSSGSTRKITASTSPSTTRLAIWTSPPWGPAVTPSTVRPTLSRNRSPVAPVATRSYSARRSRLKVAKATRSAFLPSCAMMARRGRSDERIDLKPPAIVLTIDQTPHRTASNLPQATIPTQSVCLSTERDGRETFPATVRHDGVEDPPRATLELAAGIGLIEPSAPRLHQEMSSRKPNFPNFHDDSVTELGHENFGHSSKKPTGSLTTLHMTHHAACNSCLGSALPPGSRILQEVREQRMAVFGKDRFWMKLDAREWILTVPQPHDRAVIGPRGDLQLGGQTLAIDDERVVTGGRKR